MKGQGGTIALIFGLALWGLFMILGSMYLFENPSRAELYAETSSEKNAYQLHAASSAVISRESVANNLSRHTYLTGDEREDLADITNETLKTMLSQQSANYYFELRGTDIKARSGPLSRMEIESFVTASPSSERKTITIGVGQK